MSAFPRLCTLGHLDLDLLGAGQIAAGYTESSTGHLLDGRAAVQSVRTYGKTILILTTLTGIGLTM